MQISRSQPHPRNLCGQVVHDLGCRILAGELKPGDSLPQEGTLCLRMGVSRTVVREAVKSLAAKGLIESRPKRGTIVRPAWVWNFLDPEVLGWQMRADEDGRHLFHLTELRRTIEPTAAGLAAERATDDDLQLVRGACEQMERMIDNVDGFLVADIRFHVEILHAAGNPFFAPVANVISVALESFLRLISRQPADNRASIPVHRAVMEAVCAHKPIDARDAMQSLLDEAVDRVGRALEKRQSLQLQQKRE